MTSDKCNRFMWPFGRPRRELPVVNYNEDTDSEENFEDGLEFNSPLVSPRRPQPTREGSPVEVLGGPTLADNVDDKLEEVQWKLNDLAVVREEIEEVTDLLQEVDTRVGGDDSELSEVGTEVEDVGIVVETPQVDNCQEPLTEDEESVINMAAFEDINENDDDKALSAALGNLKGLEFDQNDVKFFFNQLEIKMTSAGVKKQYTKLQVLGSAIPKHVQDQVKTYLSKSETEFPQNNAYKLLKTRILKIYGTSETAGFERALQRTLTGKPSELARVLVSDICEHELDGCCCRKAVATLWKRNLPVAVRQAVASLEFNKDTFETVVGVADSVFMSTRPSGISVAAIQATPGPVPSWTATRPLQATPDLNQGFVADPGDSVQVAAQSIIAAVQGFNRGGRGRSSGGRGGRNHRGSGRGRGARGGSSQGQAGGTGGSNRWSNLKRHADNPPLSSCKKHYLYGKSAHWCEEPGTCPWKEFWVPKGQQ